MESRLADGGAFSILTVCTANICRSPLAERLLRSALAARGGTHRFQVHSEGSRAWVGAPMDPASAAELRRLGGDPDGFRARDLSSADCLASDLILTATSQHRTIVLEQCPQALKRTFTLLEFAHLAREVGSVRSMAGKPTAVVRAASSARGAATLVDYDVRDPYGQPPEVHRAVADIVHAAVSTVAWALTGAPG